MATGNGRRKPPEMRIALLAVTEGGRRLAARIAKALPNAELIPDQRCPVKIVQETPPPFTGGGWGVGEDAACRALADSPPTLTLPRQGGGDYFVQKSLLQSSNRTELIPERRSLAEVTSALWPHYDGLIFVMAAGIVTRLIAPLLLDKRHDPGVVVLDEKGRFAVSLLSGHLGGANDLARLVAQITGGQAVITTASDTLGHTALDLWAQEQNLAVADNKALTRACARLVNTGVLKVFSEIEVDGLPQDFLLVNDPLEADIIISFHKSGWPETAALLVPRLLVLGIGCNRGASEEQIGLAVQEALDDLNLSELAIRNLASIDLKQDEAGLLAFAEARGLAISWFNKDQLNAVAGPAPSATVHRATGAFAVAEPAALLSSASHNLLLRKRKWKDITLAIAQANSTLSAPAPAV